MKPLIKGATEKELVEMMLTDKPSKMIWNVAIDRCLEEIESKSHILLPLAARIKLLKK